MQVSIVEHSGKCMYDQKSNGRSRILSADGRFRSSDHIPDMASRFLLFGMGNRQRRWNGITGGVGVNSIRSRASTEYRISSVRDYGLIGPRSDLTRDWSEPRIMRLGGAFGPG